MGDRLETLVDGVQRMAAGEAGASDAELLGRFVRGRDPAALELVVWRHGAMVQAVCRRVLGRSPEVDDAFQATFLVLLRQARSIRRRESLAGWLHRVALRVAQRALRSVMARRRREGIVARPEALPPVNVVDFDFGPLLHAEIDRLPERLRVAFVLCHLEGKTNKEAARHLGVPHGTVLSRLSRARDRLRRRLLQRGVTGAAIVTALGTEPGLVAAALVDSAVREAIQHLVGVAGSPAAILAQGVIQTMIVRKLTMIAASVVVASTMIGVGLTMGPGLLVPARADDGPPAAKAPPAEPAEKPKPAEAPPAASPLDLLVPKKPLRPIHPDEAKIIGTWAVAEVLSDGEPRDPQDMMVGIGPFGTMMIHGEKTQPMTYKVDPSSNPPSIVLTSGGKSQLGIYKIGDADVLILCMSLKGDKLPAEFNWSRGSGTALFSLRKTSTNAETHWADALFPKGRQHNFGPLKPHERKTFKFAFKNVYDRPVRIVGSGQLPDKHEGASAPPGFGPMGPGGMGPMGGGGELAATSIWAHPETLPTTWLQPGEETEIAVTADGSLLSGAATLKVLLNFSVRGFETPPSSAISGMAPGGSPMGGSGPAPGGGSGRAGRRTEAVTSTVALTLHAQPEGGK